MPARQTCPPSVELDKLIVGQLSEPEVEELAAHIEQCPRCAETIRGLHLSDSLLEAAQGSRSAGGESGETAVEQLIQVLKGLRPAPAAPPAGEATQAGFVFPGAPARPDEIGRLGGYRVLEQLGAGGMGLVYKAEDAQLQRTVALKVLKPEMARNATARERFLREARAAARLKSDHVVNIFQVGEDRDVVFLAMECLEGMSLDDRLKREQPPTLAEAVDIGRQIALGLSESHACGLIHRDVKPGNVWLDSAHQGRVKLLDFGLARPAADEQHLTHSGTIVGTPAYMAPEQARGEQVDPRADLFSLGVVLYRLTTGRLPFRGDNTIAVLTSLALDTPLSPREVNPAIPPRFAALIERLLSKDREQRPATAKVVADELAAIEREAAQPAADERTQQVASGRHRPAVPAAGRRLAPAARRWLTAAALLLLLGGVAAAIVVIIRDKDGNKVAEIEVPPGGSVETQDKGARKGPPAGKAKADGRIEDPWVQQVAALPAEKQVEAVVSKLKECNPGFDGKVYPTIEHGAVTGLLLYTDNVTSLSSLRALTGLKSLRCPGSQVGNGKLADLSPLQGMPLTQLDCPRTPVSDLSPLKGMPLTKLMCHSTQVRDLTPVKGMPLTYLDCWNTGVPDLSPLKDMKLIELHCGGTPVSDLSPLKGMPLKELVFDFKPERGDAAILRSIKTLEKINNKPAAEFWK